MTSVDWGSNVYCSFMAGDRQPIAMEKHVFESGQPRWTTFKHVQTLRRCQCSNIIDGVCTSYDVHRTTLSTIFKHLAMLDFWDDSPKHGQLHSNAWERSFSFRQRHRWLIYTACIQRSRLNYVTMQPFTPSCGLHTTEQSCPVTHIHACYRPTVWVNICWEAKVVGTLSEWFCC